MRVHPSDRTTQPPLPPALDASAPARVPGPVDRVHFLDEQRRYRRATRRFTVLAALAVVITGIPACIIVTPLLFTVAMTIGHIVNAISPISPETLEALRGFGQSLSVAADTLEASLDASAVPSADALARIALVIGVLVLPGALALFLLWIGIRRVLGRVAVGHVLEAAGGRPPNERDLEERQLRNVVDEMAVAAGVTPPRLLIIDTEAMNAAAMGTEIDDATVFVTRGLLDKLDRDETQAVIGHVIGSVGNGDLRIASIIFSIYQTWGALTLLMQAPFGRDARRAVWRGLRTAFRGRTRAVDRWEAEFVSETFLRGAVDFEDSDIARRMNQPAPDGFAGKRDAAINMLSLPLTLGSYVVQFAVFFSSVALIGPIVSFMWRTRRHLADAMAVQLTRNPDALARALNRLTTATTVVPQGDELSLLFVVWPPMASSKHAVVGQFTRMHPKPYQRQQRLIALGAANVVVHKPPGVWTALRDTLSPSRWNKMTPLAIVVSFLFFVVVPVLMAVAAVLSVILVVMLTMLSLMLMSVMMFIAWGVLNFLFLTLPGWIRR